MKDLTEKISCIAIDDEPLALEQMEKFIGKIPFLSLSESFSSATKALSYLTIHQADIIFLDVQMEDLTGIQFIEVLTRKPLIILTTAYEAYALKAYELEIFDYLLKPISFQRLLKSVTRAREVLKFKSTSVQKRLASDFIFVKTEHQLQKIFIPDILYVESMSNYLIIHLEREKVYVLMSFEELGKMLPPDKFYRVHRSYIIALEQVDRISKAHLEIGKQTIPLGPKYKQAFFKELETRKLINP
jgi:two-component system, LytTR family, response regulator